MHLRKSRDHPSRAPTGTLAIVPVLKGCVVCHKPESKHAKADHKFERNLLLPQWKGFYALRCGIGTALTDVDDALAAKSHLRHSSILTTAPHHIKSVDTAAVRAVDKISELFDNANGSGYPN
jgi:hypothetical protein